MNRGLPEKLALADAGGERMETNSKPPPFIKIPWLGVEIEKRTDFLALTAFLLALLATLFQIYGYLRGPKVKLFPPEQVLFIADRYSDNLHVIRINARMAYVNSGDPGQNATIRKERVRFTFGEKTYEQTWQAFQTFDNVGTKLIPYFRGEARPVPINAGSSISHETYFAPHPIRCPVDNPKCKKWENLINLPDFLKGVAGLKPLELSFYADIFDKKTEVARCKVDIDNDLLESLISFGWYAPRCWAD